MKRLVAGSFMLFCLAAAAQAQWINMKDIRVANLEMVSRVAGESIDTTTLTEMFQVALVDLHAFKLVERALVDKILAEQEFQSSGLTDSQIAKVGALVGANKILSLSISKLGADYIVIVKSIDTSSGIVDLSDQVQCERISELVGLLPALADRFVRKARGESVAAFASAASATGASPAGAVAPGRTEPGASRSGLVSEWLFDGDLRDGVARRAGRIVDVKLGKDRFGKPDRAAYFNGKSSGIDMGAVFPGPVEEFTVALWFYIARFNPPAKGYAVLRAPFVSNWNRYVEGGQKGFDFGIFLNAEAGHEQFNTTICDGRADRQGGYLSLPPKKFEAQYGKRWIFAALVVRDGTSTVYIDGAMAGRLEAPSAMVPDAGAPFWIGFSEIDYDLKGNHINYLNGAVDELRIYERALDEREILALMDSGE